MKTIYLSLMCLLGWSVYAQTENIANTSPARFKIGEPWHDTTIQLIMASNARTNVIEKVAARCATYQDPQNPKGVFGEFPVLAVHDPLQHKISIIQGGANFYICDESGITGYWLGLDDLQIITNEVQMPDEAGGMDKAITQFEKQFDFDTQFDTRKRFILIRENRRNPNISINLRSALPPFYNSDAASAGGPAINPQFDSVSLEDGLLRLAIRNPVQKSSATLWIDLKAKKVVRSVVDGVEMDISGNYAVPLPKK